MYRVNEASRYFLHLTGGRNFFNRSAIAVERHNCSNDFVGEMIGRIVVKKIFRCCAHSSRRDYPRSSLRLDSVLGDHEFIRDGIRISTLRGMLRSALACRSRRWRQMRDGPFGESDRSLSRSEEDTARTLTRTSARSR